MDTRENTATNMAPESAPMAEVQAGGEGGGIFDGVDSVSLTDLMEHVGGSGQAAANAPAMDGEQPKAEDAADPPADPAQDEGLTVDKGFQGRVNARVQDAIAKGMADVESRIRAEYEARYAPLLDAHIGREADALVDSGEFRSRERALEYLRLKQGMGGALDMAAKGDTPGGERPRDEKGRFVSTPPSVSSAGDTAQTHQDRINALVKQADDIAKGGGPDMRQVLRDDEVIGTMVAAGKWDMLRALEEWQKKQPGSPAPAGRTGTPPPTRTANNTNATRSFMDMTDDELENLNAQLKLGKKVDVRR